MKSRESQKALWNLGRVAISLPSMKVTVLVWEQYLRRILLTWLHVVSVTMPGQSETLFKEGYYERGFHSPVSGKCRSQPLPSWPRTIYSPSPPITSLLSHKYESKRLQSSEIWPVKRALLLNYLILMLFNNAVSTAEVIYLQMRCEGDQKHSVSRDSEGRVHGVFKVGVILALS
jgi:hypothetical protein